MSERARSRRNMYPLKAVAAFSACLALMSCGFADGAPAPTPTVITATGPVDLQRCFDKPLALGNEQPTDMSKPIVVKKGADGMFVGSPPPIAKSTQDKVAGAAVRIDNGMFEGSGELVRAPNGEIVAITALHVAHDPMVKSSDQDLRGIKVTDRNNKTATVVDDCYVYENAGKFDDPDNGDAPKTDLAILRLSNQIGDSALTVSTQPVERGSWNEYFYNFQDGRLVTNPATYGGIAVSNSTDSGRFTVLTGIENGRDCAIQEAKDWHSDCAISSGASGGPVVNGLTGTLDGISVAAQRSDNARYYTAKDLKEYVGVDMQCPTGPDSGVWPELAYIVPADIIDQVLESSVYRS